MPTANPIGQRVGRGQVRLGRVVGSTVSGFNPCAVARCQRRTGCRNAAATAILTRIGRVVRR